MAIEGSLDLKIDGWIKFLRARIRSHAKFWLFQDDRGSRLNTSSQKHARTDDRIVADFGLSAQHGGIGIHDDSVSDRWMSLHAANEFAVAVGVETERTERYALIQLDVFTDFARLANHDTRAVIDEEMVPDRGARVNVDPRFLMSPLGHHARYEWNIELV